MRRKSRITTALRCLSFLYLAIIFSLPLEAQKILEHEDFGTWRSIRKEKISPDGKVVAYVLEGDQLDPITVIYNVETGQETRFERSDDPSISSDGRYVVFLSKPGHEELRPYKRQKKKEEEWPSDTLVIYSVEGDNAIRLPDVKSFDLPEKWGSWLFYELKPKAITADSFAMAKKEGKKTGHRLVLRNLETAMEDTLFFIKKHLLSEKSPYLAYYSKGGPDSSFSKGIMVMDLENETVTAFDTSYLELHQWSWHDSLHMLSWISQPDSLKDEDRAVALYCSNDLKTVQVVADSSWSGLPEDWAISPNRTPEFSEDGKNLYFGTGPVRIERDSNILDEEWPVVEVWHSEDQVLYTQQANRAEREKKRSYLAKAFLKEGRLVQLGHEDLPDIILANEGNSDHALGIDDRNYQKYVTWEAHDYNDLYLVDTRKGESELLVSRVYGNARWSPEGKYIYWYAPADSSWVIMDPFNKETVTYGKELGYVFTEEVHDIPLEPGSYNSPGWTKGDRSFLAYDRYDIWSLDPEGKEEPVKLTRGREGEESFRLIRRDSDQRSWDTNERWMVWNFSEKTKGSGYGLINPSTRSYEWIINGPFQFARRVTQATSNDVILFTRESFEEYPDLRIATFPDLRNNKVISDANPQQKEYAWGTIELHRWMGPYGKEVEGLLVKPANFDPDSTYPMIVNFYEKSADGLYRHRRPYAHRSTINYPFYASRGYLIFNPDIHYTEGDPGKNALDHVNTGVDHIISMGFVDTTRMGLQGHSWGGYQIAYIIAHSDRFACAESGAPVVNMISAYGGIRWGTGLSRMFQYENTQSRLGETLWDSPDRYLRNSPIFDIPNVNTPVLIMHNDGDGHVPWYQGIEFFVALRRLGKKAWMLNYNNEPHWPLKLANRLDFNKRMQQFFDHYLMGKEAPEWMIEGLPAIEKEYNLGY